MKKSTARLFFFHWLPVIVCAGLIFWLSAIPGLESGLAMNADFILRKGAHLTEYGILAALLCRAFYRSGLSRKKSLIFPILLAIVFAASDEIHQLYVPGREGRPRDVFIDTAGILAGAGAYYYRIFGHRTAFKNDAPARNRN